MHNDVADANLIDCVVLNQVKLISLTSKMLKMEQMYLLRMMLDSQMKKMLLLSSRVQVGFQVLKLNMAVFLLGCF